MSAPTQDEQYREAIAAYGDALARLVRAYEADPELRRDLLQEVHLAVWRSFATFDRRCSVAAAHEPLPGTLSQQRLRRASWVSLDDIELTSSATPPDEGADQRHTLDRLLTLIRALDPLDRQLMLSYLEGLDAAASSDITGLSPANVATRIHRIKKLLALRFHSGEPT